MTSFLFPSPSPFHRTLQALSIRLAIRQQLQEAEAEAEPPSPSPAPSCTSPRLQWTESNISATSFQRNNQANRGFV